ncbi:PAS domain-containing protein [Chloroflexi bacterium TSY]|nr:PAS domain-containing protein [Chloroflexi bacterium TSY]
MESQICDLLLTDRQIAYLKTDSLFRIVEVSGDLALLNLLDAFRVSVNGQHTQSVIAPNRSTNKRSARARYNRVSRRSEDIDIYKTKTSDSEDTHPFIGRSLLKLIPELEENDKRLKELLHGVRSTLQLHYVERSMDSHEPNYIHMTTAPYIDESGKIVGLIQLLEDVTQDGKTWIQNNELKKTATAKVGYKK